VNRTLPHLLILCVLAAGCAPAGPPPRSHGPAASRNQSVSIPVSKQRPQAPKLRKLPNGHYRVRKPWTVDLNGRRFVVQPGYSTNGITAPEKVKQSLGDGVDRPETWAAVFHDWLFTQPGISRSQADGLFYDLLIAYGVPEQRAKLMYTTVKLYSMSKNFR
jgi:hypothetical protein